MPIVYLLGLRRDISSSIANIAFGVGGILVIMIVFGEKYVSVLKLTKYTPKVLDETQPSSRSSNTVVQLFSQDMIRSMKPDEQYEYYTKIIQKYTALRLQLSSGESSCSQVDSRSRFGQSDVEEEGRRNSNAPPSSVGLQSAVADL